MDAYGIDFSRSLKPLLILKPVQGIYANISGAIIHSFDQLPKAGCMCERKRERKSKRVKKPKYPVYFLFPPVLSSLTHPLPSPSFINIFKLT